MRRVPYDTLCNCGHIEGDHNCNVSLKPTVPITYGVCRVTGCDCRLFTPAEEAKAA